MQAHSCIGDDGGMSLEARKGCLQISFIDLNRSQV